MRWLTGELGELAKDHCDVQVIGGRQQKKVGGCFGQSHFNFIQ